MCHSWYMGSVVGYRHKNVFTYASGHTKINFKRYREKYIIQILPYIIYDILIHIYGDIGLTSDPWHQRHFLSKQLSLVVSSLDHQRQTTDVAAACEILRPAERLAPTATFTTFKVTSVTQSPPTPTLWSRLILPCQRLARSATLCPMH